MAEKAQPTVTGILPTKQAFYVRWSDKVEKEYPSLDALKAEIAATLTPDIRRLIALEAWLAEDPKAENHAKVIGQSAYTRAASVVPEKAVR